HIGINGYRGIQPIFSFADLSDDKKIWISNLILSVDLSAPDPIRNFIHWLFDVLQEYDDTVIEYGANVRSPDPNTSQLNIPYQVLLLKFLRETLCNPLVVKCIFDTEQEFISALKCLIKPIMNENNKQDTALNLRKFIFFANKISSFEYEWYSKQWNRDSIAIKSGNKQCKTDSELLNLINTIEIKYIEDLLIIAEEGRYG